MIKDGLGRFVGGFDDQWYDHTNEYWQDVKCKDVVFPIHNQYKASDVVVSYLYEQK
jgi:hypothetical protein